MSIADSPGTRALNNARLRKSPAGRGQTVAATNAVRRTAGPPSVMLILRISRFRSGAVSIPRDLHGHDDGSACCPACSWLWEPS